MRREAEIRESSAATNQGMPGATSGGRGKKEPVEGSGGILDFWPTEL